MSGEDDIESWVPPKSRHEEELERSCFTAISASKDWIESVTEKSLKYPDDIRRSLEDGVRLCELLNCLKPNSIRRINRLAMVMARLDNLNTFFSACRRIFSIRDGYLFDLHDLDDLTQRAFNEHELEVESRKRLLRVAVCIFWIAKASESFYRGPQLNYTSFSSIINDQDKKFAVSKGFECEKVNPSQNGKINKTTKQKSAYTSPKPSSLNNNSASTNTHTSTPSLQKFRIRNSLDLTKQAQEQLKMLNDSLAVRKSFESDDEEAGLWQRSLSDWKDKRRRASAARTSLDIELNESEERHVRKIFRRSQSSGPLTSWHSPSFSQNDDVFNRAVESLPEYSDESTQESTDSESSIENGRQPVYEEETVATEMAFHENKPKHFNSPRPNLSKKSNLFYNDRMLCSSNTVLSPLAVSFIEDEADHPSIPENSVPFSTPSTTTPKNNVECTPSTRKDDNPCTSTLSNISSNTKKDTFNENDKSEITIQIIDQRSAKMSSAQKSSSTSKLISHKKGPAPQPPNAAINNDPEIPPRRRRSQAVAISPIEDSTVSYSEGLSATQLVNTELQYNIKVSSQEKKSELLENGLDNRDSNRCHSKQKNKTQGDAELDHQHVDQSAFETDFHEESLRSERRQIDESSRPYPDRNRIASHDLIGMSQINSSLVDDRRRATEPNTDAVHSLIANNSLDLKKQNSPTKALECSSCSKTVCQDVAAIALKTYGLFFHITCFYCWTCKRPLGDSCGRGGLYVSGNHLFCLRCHSVNKGITVSKLGRF